MTFRQRKLARSLYPHSFCLIIQRSSSNVEKKLSDIALCTMSISAPSYGVYTYGLFPSFLRQLWCAKRDKRELLFGVLALLLGNGEHNDYTSTFAVGVFCFFLGLMIFFYCTYKEKFFPRVQGKKS